MECQHFAVGTYVKMAHKSPALVLAHIVSDTETVLLLGHDDDSVSITRPFALNQRSKT